MYNTYVLSIICKMYCHTYIYYVYAVLHIIVYLTAVNEHSEAVSPDVTETREGVSDTPIDREDEAVLITFSRKPGSLQQSTTDSVSVKVASVRYTHTLNFVREIQNLVSDFQLSMDSITQSLRGAAVGVAKGIVRQVTLNQMDEVSMVTSRVDQMETEDEGDDSLPSSRLEFKVDVATPVVIMPKSSSSDENLIIHLGKISIRNHLCEVLDRGGVGSTMYEDITVDIADVVMQAVSGFDLVDYNPTQELRCTSTRQRCFKIVNKLSISLSVKRGLNGLKLRNSLNSEDDADGWQDTDTDVLSDGLKTAVPPEYDFIMAGKVADQVSLKMSKNVFEQIKSTLKHLTSTTPGTAAAKREETKLDPSHHDNLSREEVDLVPNDIIPSFSASFLLPKISLELSQETKGKNTKFVFVVMKDFAVQASKHVPFVTDFDLQLGSFVIEDLLQSEESKYRYIFLTSTKLLPNASLLPPSLRKASMRGVSGIVSPPSFTPSFYAKPSASSSPKKGSSMESPLRAFSRKKTTVEDELGSEMPPEPTSLNRLDSLDLFISITGHLVDEKSPDFVSKHESVSPSHCRVRTWYDM